MLAGLILLERSGGRLSSDLQISVDEALPTKDWLGQLSFLAVMGTEHLAVKLSSTVR
jgi:hypothetical protein